MSSNVNQKPEMIKNTSRKNQKAYGKWGRIEEEKYPVAIVISVIAIGKSMLPVLFRILFAFCFGLILVFRHFLKSKLGVTLDDEEER